MTSQSTPNAKIPKLNNNTWNATDFTPTICFTNWNKMTYTLNPRNATSKRRKSITSVSSSATVEYRWIRKSSKALLIGPFLDLTKKAVVWHWGESQHKAFEELKTCMCSRPVLTQPDFNKPFFLQTDASAYGVGAILSQEGEHHAVASQKPKLHPIAFYSATFTPTERNYDIYEQELLAIMKALTHWRHY